MKATNPISFSTLLAMLIAGGTLLLITSSAQAGSVVDSDSDLVPDPFDNCSVLANGPNELSNQVDTDTDGYGNACDADYSNDGFTTTLDFVTFLMAFTGTAPNLATDHNGDGATTTLDFQTYLLAFQGVQPLGPSGLACAGTVPCLP